MGADTSTLQSINSLSSTLADIEKKLAVIENVHLHHERTICHDNCIVISGKQILCQANVHLVIGPMVGSVNSSSARILVECDSNAELSVNVFLMDEQSTQSRFFSSEKFVVSRYKPYAVTVLLLAPDTRYFVYIGGLSSTETLLNYATIHTLPDDPTKPIRMLFVHHGGVDSSIPGEISLWDDIESKVSVANHPRLGISSAESPVFYLAHVGDLLSVDGIIRARIIELLDMLQREDMASDRWLGVLQEVEDAIKAAYRSAFAHPALRNITKRCANIFIPGQGESAMLTASLLGMLSPHKPVTVTGSADNQSMSSAAGQSASSSSKLLRSRVDSASGSVGDGQSSLKSSMSSPKKSYGKVKVDPAVEAAQAAALAAADDEIRVLKQRGEDIEEPTDQSAEDSEVPMVGATVRREREAQANELIYRTQLQEDMRMAVLGAVLRIARRVSWSYMRQLWDDQYDALLAEDEQNESLLRNILLQRKAIHVKKLFHSHLNKTRLKLLREFGEEYNAADKVVARCKQVEQDIKALETSLQTLVENTSVFQAQTKERPNGCCLSLGRVILVIVETAWGWLCKDGQAAVPYNRSMSIHVDILNSLRSMIADGAGAGVCDKAIEADVLVLLAAAPLLKNELNSHPKTAVDEPQMFSPAAMDIKNVLKWICKWQQQNIYRTALVAYPSSHSSGEGWAGPLILKHDSDNENIEDDEEESSLDTLSHHRKDAEVVEEGWDELRCRLRQIAICPLDMKTKPQEGFNFDIEQDEEGIIDDELKFVSNITRDTMMRRRSYWDCNFVPFVPSRRAVAADMTTDDWIAAVPAAVVTTGVSDLRQPIEITLGPVVGKVGSYSAIVLLEAAHDCHVDLLCIDQITGLQHSCNRLLSAGRPNVFVFNGLVPNRAYDVFVDGPSMYLSRPTKQIASLGDLGNSGGSEAALPSSSSSPSLSCLSTGLVHGSFTTQPKRLRVIGEDRSELEEKLVSDSLREAANAIEQLGTMDDTLNDDDDTNIDQQDAVLAMPGRGVSSALDTSRPTTSANNQVRQSAPCVRIVALGANRPSWLRETNGKNGLLGLDRHHLQTGLELTRELVNSAARSWNGFDLFIHCGFNVDFTMVCDEVVTLLTRAEQLAAQFGSKMMSPLSASFTELKALSGQQEVASVRARAMEALRQAYRLHWGASHTQSLLSYGSHLFVSTPMLDMMSLFHASSLRQLARDLSPNCVHSIHQMMQELDNEYKASLWEPDMRGIDPTAANTINLSGGKEHVQYLAGGDVAVFSLLPVIRYEQDSYGSMKDSLISEQQFNCLQSILHPDDNSGLLNDVDRSIGTLVIVSPIPIIRDDPAFLTTTCMTTCQTGITFTTYEIARLFDILSCWLEEYSSREVVIVCGGTGVGFQTRIRVSFNSTDQDTAAPASSIDSSSGVIIRQVCCGGLISVAGDDSPSVFSGDLYSASRHFQFEHTHVLADPHVVMIDIDDKNQSSSQLTAVSQLCWGDFKSARLSRQVITTRNNCVIGSVASQQEELLNRMWKLIKTHVSSNVKKSLTKKEKSKLQRQSRGAINDGVIRDEMIDQIRRAVRMICQKHEETILKCYGLFAGLSLFDLPSKKDGMVVESSLQRVFAWIAMQFTTRDLAVCHIPSSLVLRQLWNKFCAGTRASRKAAVGASTEVVDQSAVSSAQLVTASLASDLEYFVKFVSQGFEAQALLEFYSYKFGLLDGWEINGD